MVDIRNSEDPDAEVVRSVAEGNEKAFEQLVEKYEHSVLNTIYRYIGYRVEAEDIAQEVFLKVWRHASDFKGRSRFSTWLYRIVVNQCLGYRKKHKEKPETLDETIDKDRASITPEAEIERRKEAEIVRMAIDELPRRQRIALILSRFEGKSYKEIAQIMGVSLSTVESLIFRARGSLKKKLLPLKKKGEI